MAATPDDARTAQINKIESYLEKLEASSDDPINDPKTFSTLMDEVTRLRTEGMKPGSGDRVALVVEAEQRSEAFKRASQQRALQVGSAFVRDRDRMATLAAQGDSAAIRSQEAQVLAVKQF